MKFYFASYFQPENHHGVIVSISRSEPKQFIRVPKCVSLVPSQQLLSDWKQGMSEAEYVDRYREEVRSNWANILFWLRVKAGQEEDLTLCCWEKSGEFCHRNLAAKIVERHFPANYGGCDIPVRAAIARPVQLSIG